MRPASTFRKRDLEVAVRAARDAGIEVVRVEVDRQGRISIVAGKPEEPITTAAAIPEKDEHEWDDLAP
jgi:hypothetical protein